mmetsp:Transcript_27609/g.39193  ORF Transcript_27609/g.39193 Transcript_27609/m.39193 type:complete len:137 (+) Transcript_27609:694-1104(+)
MSNQSKPLFMNPFKQYGISYLTYPFVEVEAMSLHSQPSISKRTQKLPEQPISQPSLQPLLLPSAQPSQQPARHPFAQSTKQPTAQPTKQPFRIQPSKLAFSSTHFTAIFYNHNSPGYQNTLTPSTQPTSYPVRPSK